MHLRIGTPLLQNPPRMAHVPVVPVKLQRDELLRGQLAEVHPGPPAVLLVADLENAPERLLMDVRIGAMALVLVVPVDDVHRAVRPVAEVEHLAPGIVGQQEVRPVGRGVAGPRSLQPVGIGAGAMDVVHENAVAVLRRPVVSAQVNHGADVRMPTACGRGPAVPGVRALLAHPVHVIGDRLHVVVDVWIEMFAGLALVSRALDHVKEMLDHADGREGVAVVVEVEPPRVAGAFREDFEHVFRRVKTPDPGVEALTLRVGCARFPHVGMCEHAVRAIEPSVGPPRERVEHLVRVLVSPSVEHHLRRPGGTILSLVDGDEQQMRRRSDPDAAEPHLDRAEEVQVLHEDLPPVESSVAVGVLEDENPVSPLAFGVRARDTYALQRPTAGRGRRRQTRLAARHRAPTPPASPKSPWARSWRGPPPRATGRRA